MRDGFFSYTIKLKQVQFKPVKLIPSLNSIRFYQLFFSIIPITQTNHYTTAHRAPLSILKGQ